MAKTIQATALIHQDLQQAPARPIRATHALPQMDAPNTVVLPVIQHDLNPAHTADPVLILLREQEPLRMALLAGPVAIPNPHHPRHLTNKPKRLPTPWPVGGKHPSSMATMAIIILMPIKRGDAQKTRWPSTWLPAHSWQ